MVGRRSHGRWNVRPQCANIKHSRKKCHMCGQKTGFKQHEGAGQSPSPLLVVFSCFFFTWCGSSLLNKVTPPEEEDELELVADAPQQEDDDSWLTLVLQMCWDAHECPTLQDSITCFSKQRGSGIPLKVTLYFPMWRVVEHQMTVLY